LILLLSTGEVVTLISTNGAGKSTTCVFLGARQPPQWTNPLLTGVTSAAVLHIGYYALGLPILLRTPGAITAAVLDNLQLRRHPASSGEVKCGNTRDNLGFPRLAERRHQMVGRSAVANNKCAIARALME